MSGYLKRFSFFFEVSLSYPFLIYLECNLHSGSLDLSTKLFDFLCGFAIFFCYFSVCPSVANVVTGCCNQSFLFFLFFFCVCVYDSRLWIVAFLHLFLTLSISSLRCKTLCIIINFLVLWSIYLSSFLVYFLCQVLSGGRQRQIYPSLSILTMILNIILRRTALVFVLLMRFLLQSLISTSFLVLLSYSFLTFSFTSVWWCALLIFPNICNYFLILLFASFPHPR